MQDWQSADFAKFVQYKGKCLLYLCILGEFMLSVGLKAEIVQKFQRQPNDTGSSEVQIALLTARIKDLQKHFDVNKKDVHSRRGLMKLVATRRKLLKYLQNIDLAKYRKLIEELELRG